MFYLYVVVSATLLVQSLHSARWSGDDFYSRQAFPQSKDLFIERTPQSREDYTPHLIDIKRLLAQLVDKIGTNSRNLKRETKQKQNRKSNKSAKGSKSRSPIPFQWHEWSDWSPCSVSCGKGREIRWRRCNKGCNGVDIEMHEKPCQLPACGGKLFGIINL